VPGVLQVSVVVGPANEGIQQLAKQGVRFDLAFLDADKGGYLGYYNQVAAYAVGKCSISSCCAAS
jgi:predicted O-methyltransferase YrrM